MGASYEVMLDAPHCEGMQARTAADDIAPLEAIARIPGYPWTELMILPVQAGGNRSLESFYRRTFEMVIQNRRGLIKFCGVCSE